MLVGYARTSTLDQTAGLEAQLRDLSAAGCEKVFQEQVSSVDTLARQQLNAALEFVREGDHLVVTKLDRLARSVAHLVELKEKLLERGAHLIVLEMNLDTSTATGSLILNLVGSIAEFERQIMLERQREGIAKAKAAGKYKGRAPTARAKAIEVHLLAAEGMGATQISKELGIGRASVYRILAEKHK